MKIVGQMPGDPMHYFKVGDCSVPDAYNAWQLNKVLGLPIERVDVSADTGIDTSAADVSVDTGSFYIPQTINNDPPARHDGDFRTTIVRVGPEDDKGRGEWTCLKGHTNVHTLPHGSEVWWIEHLHYRTFRMQGPGISEDNKSKFFEAFRSFLVKQRAGYRIDDPGVTKLYIVLDSGVPIFITTSQADVNRIRDTHGVNTNIPETLRTILRRTKVVTVANPFHE